MNLNFPVELQMQVERAIAQEILAKGQVLTLPELEKIFKTDRAALESVLQAEERKGLISRQGTDIRILGVQEKGVDSLFQHTSRAGLKPTSIIRNATIEPADAETAARLELPLGAPVYRLVRTRLINDEVLANQVNFIPYEVCPGLENEDVSRYSFQKLLEERYYTIITQIQEEMRIVPGSESDLRVLGLPLGALVLIIDRLSYSCNRLPVVWASIHIRTDRYHYVSTLWSQAAPLLQEHNLIQ